ncbi:50S ribosomal protein L3 [Candidatus Dependentiae bacterium]
MLSSFYGTKVGMTQLFGEDRKAVPVTVIKLGTWFVTQIKTKDKDGYSAVQVGMPRKRFDGQPFSKDWLKKKKAYFLYLRELFVDGDVDLNMGDQLSYDKIKLENGDLVWVGAKSKGLGFQGVMRRWGFAGGPGGHGSTFHRAPGSIGNLVFRGEVFKGKKLPGRTGGRMFSVKNLKVVKVDAESGHVIVSGSVPGKKNSLVIVRK